MSIEEKIEKRLKDLRTGLMTEDVDVSDIEQIVEDTREFILKVGREIRRIIESEKAEGRLPTVTLDNWYELLQIFEANILEISDVRAVKLPENFRATASCDVSTEPIRRGEFIFVAAPTGAGKDSLVARIISESKIGRPVVLNVDKFRQYYTLFEDYLDAKYPGGLKDKTFAMQTRDFSNDIYTVMEQLLLENFPGINIIITGTLSEPEWVKMIFKRIKAVTHTQYTTRMYGLIAKKGICHIATVQRYLSLIREDKPGTARYTSKEYLNVTVDNFARNFGVFEDIFNTEAGVIDSISLFRRAERLGENEESLKERRLYTTESDIGNISTNGKVQPLIRGMINAECEISEIELERLLEQAEKFKKYLMLQGVYTEVRDTINSFMPRGLGRTGLKTPALLSPQLPQLPSLDGGAVR